MERFIHVQIYNEAGTEIEYDNMDDNISWGIDSGSVSLEQILMEKELRFGEINASRLGLVIFGIDVDLSNRKIKLSATEELINYLVTSQNEALTTDIGEYINVTGSANLSLFTGYVQSCEKDRTHTDRSIVAYDWLYFHRDDNIANAWNTFWENRETSTLKTLRDALLTNIGITVNTKTLINDDMPITNNFVADPSSFKLGDILSMITVLQNCTPHINGDGELDFVTLDSATIYNVQNNLEGENSTWKDFTTNKITGIGVYSTSNDLAQLVGTATNVYNIAGNIFLLNKTANELTAICTAILNGIKDIQYIPTELSMIVSRLDFNLGDKLVTSFGTTYMFTNRLSGMLLVDQTTSCLTDGENLENSVDDINDYIINGNKIAKVQKDIDGLAIEFSDFAQDITTKVEVTASSILATVSGTTHNYDEEDYDIDNYRYGDPDDDPALDPTEHDLEYLLNQTNGDLWYCNGLTWTKIKTLNSVQEALQSQIEVQKGQIVLKVNSQNRLVEVGLNNDPDTGNPATFYVDADYINLSAQHKLTLITGTFEVNSTYLQISDTGELTCTSVDIEGGDINLGNGVFHVDNLGQLYCSNAEVEGIIRATSGEIGDLTLVNGVLSNTYSGSSMAIDTNDCKISFDDGDNKIEIQDGNIIGYNYLSFGTGLYKWYEACSIEVYRGEMVIGAEDLYLGGYQYNYALDTKTFNEAVHIDEYGYIYATSALSATGSLWVEGGLSVEDGLTVNDTGITVTTGDVEIQDGNITVSDNAYIYGSLTAIDIYSGAGTETSGEHLVLARVKDNDIYIFANADGRAGLYSTNHGNIISVRATANHEKDIDGSLYIGTQCYVANNRVFTTADASTGGVTHNYNTVAWIKSDGGMEIGYYIDFHDGHDSDKDARILYSYSNNRLEATPSIVSTSSRKVKKNIDDITDEEANLILQLRPRKFDFKSTNTDEQKERGFIAEEVQDIIPNLVCEEEGEEGTKRWMPMGLKYDDIIAYLVKVVQRQEREINELKGE